MTYGLLSRGVRVVRRALVRGQKVDPATVQFESDTCTRLWSDAAKRLGISVTHHHGCLIMTANQRTLRVRDHLASCESAFGFQVCGNKPLTNSLLRDAGVNVPDGRTFAPSQRDEAIRYALSIAPCVTKPSSGAFGTGVSVNLMTARQIRRGFNLASLFGEVLVERFAHGDNYRALVYRGRCLSIVKRQLAAVIGDGHSTIAELVARENESRVGSLLRPLRSNGNTAIPASGEPVTLAKVCNYQHGTSYAECLSGTHPEILSAVERAALAVDAVVAGVDVISPDISGPEYVVNEVNTTPLLLIHYAAPDHRDPIREILRQHFSLDSTTTDSRHTAQCL